MSKEDKEKKHKSNWFRVAVAGDTTDGREIQSDWIIQMADSYDPNTYGARINIEHLRSVYPGSAFGAYGDVLALKTEKVTIDGDIKLLGENESIYIPLGATHCLENPGKIPLDLIEVRSGSYLEEDDVVRFADRYGRV